MPEDARDQPQLARVPARQQLAASSAGRNRRRRSPPSCAGPGLPWRNPWCEAWAADPAARRGRRRHRPPRSPATGTAASARPDGRDRRAATSGRHPPALRSNPNAGSSDTAAARRGGKGRAIRSREAQATPAATSTSEHHAAHPDADHGDRCQHHADRRARAEIGPAAGPERSARASTEAPLPPRILRQRGREMLGSEVRP